jgi:hypothetical protein
MKTMTIVLGILTILALLFMLLANALLGWIAKGEPDSNGDPERDASGIDKLP